MIITTEHALIQLSPSELGVSKSTNTNMQTQAQVPMLTFQIPTWTHLPDAATKKNDCSLPLKLKCKYD